jgi:uncharacterized protein (TIGR00369 family)
MESITAVTEPELKRVLSESPFARIYQFELESFGKGTCTLRMPFQKELERPGGIVAGSVLMAAADVAMWLAIMTILGCDALTVTTELNTSFIGSACNEEVKCTARVLKAGKTLVHGVAQCTNAQDRLLTNHTITYYRK